MESVDTTGKIIWVCRENIGRSQVAEVFCRRDYPEFPTMSAGILVDKPGQPIGDCPVADTLIKVMQANYDIDLTSRKRTSIDDLTYEELGKAALVVVLAESEVVPDDLSSLENAILWPVPDMKETDIEQTQHIVKVIEKGIAAIYKTLPSHLKQQATSGQQELPFDEAQSLQ